MASDEVSGVPNVELTEADSAEPTASASAALEALRRWEASGATWQVINGAATTEHEVEIELLACTGGEVVDLIRSSDADLLSYVRHRNPPES